MNCPVTGQERSLFNGSMLTRQHRFENQTPEGRGNRCNGNAKDGAQR
jgi:hypothetical protein